MELISIKRKDFDALAERIKTVEAMASVLLQGHGDMGIKKWLDHQEVCQLLGIGKRTLQSYREKGLLPYSQIRNKIYYKPQDVEKLLSASRVAPHNHE